MKTFILLPLLLLSSCALYQDFKETEFNWLGSGKPQKTSRPAEPRSVEETETEMAQESVPTVPFEEMISKNWEYTQRKDPLTHIKTYEASTLTEAKDATLTVLRNDRGQTAIVMGLNKELVSYREGHSVELKLDGESQLAQVEASEGKVSKEVKFSDGKDLAKKLDGKKELVIEVHLNGKGSKLFRFDISDLQKYFTAI